MAHRTLPIILLAAGASSRMRGRDKLLEDIDGTALLRRQATAALDVTTGPVIVALPAPPHPRYEALAGLNVTNITVPDAAEGMNASLRRAFEALPPDASCAMLLLADLPDLTAADLARVADAVDLTSASLIWRGTTEDGKPGHPIVFHADLFDRFCELSGDSGGRAIVQQAEGRITDVALSKNHALNDLDTPEDWAAWRASRDT